jgi:hypothetical protein
MDSTSENASYFGQSQQVQRLKEADQEDAYKNDLQNVIVQLCQLRGSCTNDAKWYPRDCGSNKTQANDGEQLRSKSGPLLLAGELHEIRGIALVLCFDWRRLLAGWRRKLLGGGGVHLFRGNWNRYRTSSISPSSVGVPW